MNPNKECPKQFVTVSNILTAIYVIIFLGIIIFAPNLRLTIYGKVSTFPLWVNRLVLVSFTGILIYLLQMLRKCSIWAIFLLFSSLILDILGCLISAIFAKKFNLIVIIDVFCLNLLIQGYIEYRDAYKNDTSQNNRIPIRVMDWVADLMHKWNRFHESQRNHEIEGDNEP